MFHLSGLTIIQSAVSPNKIIIISHTVIDMNGRGETTLVYKTNKIISKETMNIFHQEVIN